MLKQLQEGKEDDEDEEFFKQALQTALNHNLLPKFIDYHSTAHELDADEWKFGDDALSDPLEDMRAFNKFLLEHFESPIPYKCSGKEEGYPFLTPDNCGSHQDELSLLVLQAKNHPCFETYNKELMDEDNTFQFGEEHPMFDLNLFDHYLCCLGEPQLKRIDFDEHGNPMNTHMDMKAETQDTDKKQDSDNNATAEGFNTDHGEERADKSDEDDDDDNKFEIPHHQYPLAPTVDHPRIKNILKSAAKARAFVIYVTCM